MTVVAEPRAAVPLKQAHHSLPPELQALINRVNHELEGKQKRKERLVRENRDFLFGRFIFE